MTQEEDQEEDKQATIDTHAALELAERIKPMLAGQGPEVQGAALAELVSIWITGFNEETLEQTAITRAMITAHWIDTVLKLTVAMDAFQQEIKH